MRAAAVVDGHIAAETDVVFVGEELRHEVLERHTTLQAYSLLAVL